MNDMSFADSPVGAIEPVLSVSAENSLEFLEQVFSCWNNGRLFAMTRDPAVLADLGMAATEMPRRPGGTGGWARFDHRPRVSDDPAQIVFSSGTEGRPKAILLSHRNLADVVMRLNAAMGVTEEIREYIGVPVTYSFGLGRARAVAAAGGSVFLPERFDPVQIRDMLKTGEINAISAVPSLWRQVLAAPEALGAEARKVRWIEIGSQVMSAADKAAMRALFPEARIIQHYGLTEASRTTFLDVSEAPEAVLGSVGRAGGSVALRIAEDGAIAIRGDHVALGQVMPGGIVRPLADREGWLHTRDRGSIRDGWLWYEGRLDDQINLGGIKLGAEALEDDIRRLVPLAGSHIAVAPVPDPRRGEAVLLAVERAAADLAPLLEGAARLSLARRGVQVGQGPSGAIRMHQLDSLPRTATDKVQRRLLPGLWAESLADAPAPAAGPADAAGTPLTPAEARLAAIWARVLGHAPADPSAGFHDLGGDSLSAVQIGLVMEAERLPRPVIRATMEGRSLRDAAALMDEAEGPSSPQTEALPPSALRSWSISMTRAVMILSVILSHWAPGLFGRLGIAGQAEAVLSVFYRMGTPGFAAVFGIGVGYLMLPDFAARSASVLTRVGRSFRLVAGGLVLLAAIRLANLWLDGKPVGGLDLARGLYGVLAYYAVALGTARWWLPQLARLSRPIPALLALAPALWVAGAIAPSLLPDQPLQSLLEWPRLMLVANYNIFRLSAVAAGGMAIGLWIARQKDDRRVARVLLTGGGLAMAIMALSLRETGGAGALTDRTSPLFTSLPGLVFYLSFAAFGTGLFLHLLLSWATRPGWLRIVLRLLLVIGGMALPIYVLHGMVIPGRDLLVTGGLPGGLALLIPMGLFLATTAYGGRRLWRVYAG